MSEESRRHPRYESAHPVEAKCATWSQFLKIHSQNISKGGMFLCVDQAPEIDTRLEVRLGLPNGNVLSLHARVAHVIDLERAAAEGRRAGFGLEFDALTLEEEAALDDLVETAKRHEQAPPPPLPKI